MNGWECVEMVGNEGRECVAKGEEWVVMVVSGWEGWGMVENDGEWLAMVGRKGNGSER